jgi:hypothetical protein
MPSTQKNRNVIWKLGTKEMWSISRVVWKLGTNKMWSISRVVKEPMCPTM